MISLLPLQCSRVVVSHFSQQRMVSLFRNIQVRNSKLVPIRLRKALNSYRRNSFNVAGNEEYMESE